MNGIVPLQNHHAAKMLRDPVAADLSSNQVFSESFRGMTGSSDRYTVSKRHDMKHFEAWYTSAVGLLPTSTMEGTGIANLMLAYEQLRPAHRNDPHYAALQLLSFIHPPLSTTASHLTFMVRSSSHH